MCLSRLGNEIALLYRLAWSALVGTSCCSLSASPIPSRVAGVVAKICGYCSGMRVKRREDSCWGKIWNSLIFDVFYTNWRCSHWNSDYLSIWCILFFNYLAVAKESLELLSYFFFCWMTFCINFISASCVKLNKIQFCNICLKKESTASTFLS